VVLFAGDATRSVSRGVAIDYYLKQPADKVTISSSIRRKADPHLRRRAATPAPADASGATPAPAPPADDTFRPPAATGRETGAEPCTRYPDAKDRDDRGRAACRPRPATTIPGAADGREQTRTQPFAILRVRKSATEEDLSEQFTLANRSAAR
jgi:hypothetical protein